jgi:hypothetical protein
MTLRFLAVQFHREMVRVERRYRGPQTRRRTVPPKYQELQRSEFISPKGKRLAHMGSWAFDSAGFDYWPPESFRIYGLEQLAQRLLLIAKLG